MCKYCETVYAENDHGRKFGDLFPKELNYDGEVQLSWVVNNDVKEKYNIYMNDDVAVTDISAPIHYCPMCGRKLD